MIVGGRLYDGARIELDRGLAFLWKKGVKIPKVLEWDEEKVEKTTIYDLSSRPA